MNIIETHMFLGYALATHDCISYKKIIELHDLLISTHPDLLTHSSRRDVQEYVAEHNGLVKLKQTDTDWIISIEKRKLEFFDVSFLDRCYEPFFEPNKFTSIKNILMNW